MADDHKHKAYGEDDRNNFHEKQADGSVKFNPYAFDTPGTKLKQKANRHETRSSVARTLARNKAKLVAQAYVKCGGNKTETAKELGGTWNKQSVYNWLGRKDVQDAVKRLIAKRDAVAIHSREEAIAALANGAYGDRTSIFVDGTFELKPFDEWPEDMKCLVEGVDWKTPKGMPPIPVVKLMSREGCIDKLGKELGLWKDKSDMNVSGTIGVRLITNVPQDED